MLLRRFYDDKLAQAGYMVGCQATGEALVVDANRDVDVYLAAAAEEDVTIRYVTETHIHADYLSGSRELAARTGARLLLSAEAPPEWRYAFAEADGARLVRDGDEVSLGNVRIRVLHTPGHTPEHISFMITDGAASDAPMGVLTGDFVFVGDVGRPDLLEKAAGVKDTMEQGARELYRSLERFRTHPGYLQILPGHGAGSACGKALGAVPTSTLGYERLAGWAFQCRTEEEFVTRVLQDQPEPPRYFAEMKRRNRDGPPLLGGMPRPPRLDPGALPEILRRGDPVVDARARERFAEAHLPGTLNIPLTRSFPSWCGWLLPYDRPIHLVVDGPEQAREAVRDLILIGLDRVAGWFDAAEMEAWAADHGPLDSYRVVDWPGAERRVREDGAVLVDVRSLTEWNEARVPGAHHIHLGVLRDRAGELPPDRPVLLYCRTGSRSGIAAGVLRAQGLGDVANVEGGIEERMRLGLAVERGAVRGEKAALRAG